MNPNPNLYPSPNPDSNLTRSEVHPTLALTLALALALTLALTFAGRLPSAYTDAVRVLKMSCGAPPSATGGEPSAGGGCLSGTLPTELGTAGNLEW